MTFRICFGAIATIAAIHLVIGSDPLAVFLVSGTVLIGLAPLIVYGLRNISAILTALFALRYVGFGAVFKLLEGETLESGLYVPTLSFAIILVGVITVVFAFEMSRLVPVGRIVFRPAHDPVFLLRLSAVSAVIGIGAHVVLGAGLVQGELGNALRFLRPFAILSVVAVTAACIIRTDGRRSFNLLSVGVLAALVAVALVVNSREGVYEAVIAYLVTCLAFGKRFRPLHVAFGVVAAYIFVAGLSPAMIEVRKYRSITTPVQLLSETLSATVDRLFGQSDRPAFDSDPSARYQVNYFGSVGSSLDRFVIVQQADIVIATAAHDTKLGYSYVTDNLANLLPGFLNPDKNPAGRADYLFWYYGLLPFDLNANLSPTLLGESFAISGWVTVVLFAFLMSFAWFLIFRKLGEDPMYNIWPIFFLVTFVHTFTEQGIGSNLFELLRGLPALLILTAGLIWALRLIDDRKGVGAPPVPANERTQRG